MASSPPFHVMEDQTDEDFFDKLVDDDVFRGPTSSDSASRFLEGSDSDEAKAFSNMSLEETCDEGYYEGNGKKDSVCSGSGLSAALAGGRNGNNNAMNSFTSAGSDAIIDSNNNDGDGSDVIMDPTTSKSSGSTKSGVKEVGWSSFYADSVPNSNHGYGSFSDFFNDLGGSSEDFPAKADESVNGDNRAVVGLDNSVNHDQYQDGTDLYRGSVSESVNEPAFSSSQNWENMYPGWKYDVNTGQWYQVDGYNATPSVQGSFDANAGNGWAATSDGKTEVNYLQHTSQTVVGTVAETSTTESVSSWNQVLQENNNGYPEHMVFDPQYPGWYYDTVAQEWCSLESYTSSTQSATVETHDRQNQSNGFDYSGSYSQNSTFMYGESGRNDLYGLQSYNSQGQLDNWSGYQQFKSSYDLNVSMNNHVNQHNSLNSLGKVPSHDNMGDGNAEANGFVGSRSLVPNGNFSQQFNHENATQNELMKTSSDYYGIQKPASVAQLSVYSNQQFPHGSDVGRSPIGRPPHALVTFGFGGKLIVMKDSRSLGNSSFSSQDPVGTSISVLSLMEVVSGSTENASSIGRGTCDYFHTLCHHSFPGPLVGGSVGSKELNKWIDEQIANCESHDMDYRKSEALKLLLSLLKIACQHYGKFRSPFGTDSSLRESDAPESAVANLFASAKRNGTEFTEDGALSHCLRSLPSEGQIRASASEVQNLLVAGRKKEALQCAQEGQLWGPALVLASQLGEQFYVDTVKQMALRQLVAGSPLRTLCLLIAGQPADVFSTESMSHRGLPGAVNISQVQQPVQFGANGMLDDWEENLAVITANRTKDDELVIIHLGDCLWKDRSEITAAHICYLVAEANFESYSDSARLCLIGADHWKQPRTYVSPEAIQRTELYEYSKVLGNSQFILLPFQPYKLIYAHMLAEVGKVSDSLKYCQAVLKSLKTGRAPEVEMWKQLVLTLEERIRTHQQGGYTANLAPGKLVGKLLNFFDSTAHRVVGGLPPPVSSQSAGSVQSIENIHQAVAPRVLTSQSTMAMSSLMPSASMEPISEWAADNNRMAMHNRSVSEPDFGRTPRQVDSKEETSLSAQSKTSGSAGASRFGRFGFGSQLLQKTVGLVLGPRPGRQAKLGEKNKFYYDEKLKRWVEEGAEPPSEETALPPPPTTAAFQNGSPDYNIKSALKNDSSPTNGSPRYMSPSPPEQSSGIPPIPTSSNQFSARGRMGVRSRYVDTFNQGNVSSAKLFQSPSVPSVKSAVASNAKFFIPAPAPSNEYSMEAAADNAQDISETAENPSTSVMNESFTSSSSMNMQRYPSMDHIARKQAAMNGGGPVSSHSRRTASWNGSFGDSIRPAEPKPLGEVLGMPPSSFMPSHPPMTHMPTNGGSIGEDLHEVEL